MSRTPENSREPWEAQALARLHAADAAVKQIPTPATKYVLEIYTPEDRHPWMSFTSSTPFGGIAAGDVLDTRAWPVRTWPRLLASNPLRVVRVEHILFSATKPAPPEMQFGETPVVITVGVTHSVQIFTQEIFRKADLLDRDGRDEDERKLAASLAAIPRDEAEWEWAAGLLEPEKKGEERREK